jgi:hypothetical protein
VLLSLVVFCGFRLAPTPHPFFVSVVEVEHNAKEQQLEISCKIFTDDFEKTLRMHNPGVSIDLINPKDRAAMNRLVTAYIQQHLSIKPDGKAMPMQFLGFEQHEEAIYSYWQINGVAAPQKIAVFDNLLYEYKKEQTNIIHAIVGGQRKTTRLLQSEVNWVAVF